MSIIQPTNKATIKVLIAAAQHWTRRVADPCHGGRCPLCVRFINTTNGGKCCRRGLSGRCLEVCPLHVNGRGCGRGSLWAAVVNARSEKEEAAAIRRLEKALWSMVPDEYQDQRKVS